MANLLVKPRERDAEGRVLAVTPESAGWSYVGFEVFTLKPGEKLARGTAGREHCVVLLAGRGSVTAGGRTSASSARAARLSRAGPGLSTFQRIPISR